MGTLPDYYLILGVPKTASAAEIKSAYRQLVKKWHPDVNSTKEATTKSQEFNDAYSVLGSPERKALYDSGNYAAAVDPATQATEADIVPIKCDGCGAISAQPRFVQFGRVISIVIASYKSKPSGVFCVSCASKRLFFNTFITGSVGWLGIWGFFWSFEAILINVCGGNRIPSINAFVLAKQAAYFMRHGETGIARSLAEDSLKYFKRSVPSDPNYSMGVNGADVARHILEIPDLKTTRIKSRWTGLSSPALSAIFGLSIPAIFWAAILGANDKKTDYQSNSSTDSRSQHTPPPSYTSRSSTRSPAVDPEPTVSFRNTNGITYSVSRYDALRLQPIYDSLQTRDHTLKAKSASLDLQNTNLELDRLSIRTDGESTIFNQKVDKWNSDNQSRNLEVESYNQAVDSYNSDLERVGRKIN